MVKTKLSSVYGEQGTTKNKINSVYGTRLILDKIEFYFYDWLICTKNMSLEEYKELTLLQILELKKRISNVLYEFKIKEVIHLLFSYINNLYIYLIYDIFNIMIN